MTIEEKRKQADSMSEGRSLFAVHKEILSARLFALVAELPSQELRTDVLRALQEPGKLLAAQTDGSTVPAGVWSLLTFLVAEHVAPNLDVLQAATTAIAIECFLCG
ncbi:MAG TPA: hypothetical protein VKR42_11455, partial [Ktedonobacteraceae bacterium]|nr:hypothetical protein [Ktedonobacteraceae bacterium]